MAKNGFYSDGFYVNDVLTRIPLNGVVANYQLPIIYYGPYGNVDLTFIFAKTIDNQLIRCFNINDGSPANNVYAQDNSFSTNGSGYLNGRINIAINSDSGDMITVNDGHDLFAACKHSSVDKSLLYYNGYLANGIASGNIGESGKMYKNGKLYTGTVPAGIAYEGTDAFGNVMWNVNPDSMMGGDNTSRTR